MAKEKLTRQKLRRIIREEKKKLDEAGNRTPAAWKNAVTGGEIIAGNVSGNSISLKIETELGDVVTARIEGGDFYIE